MHYKKCKNGELKSNSYSKNVLLAKRPMVSLFKSLEVHIPKYFFEFLFMGGEITKMMFCNQKERV